LKESGSMHNKANRDRPILRSGTVEVVTSKPKDTVIAFMGGFQ
jgi:hypothetical protein